MLPGGILKNSSNLTEIILAFSKKEVKSFTIKRKIFALQDLATGVWDFYRSVSCSSTQNGLLMLVFYK